MTEEDSIFTTYSQSSCEYECKTNQARNECKCTPWNVPTPPSLTNPSICDVYGTHCFNLEMADFNVIKGCSEVCPADCEDVRFSINKQEIPINVDYQCGDQFDTDREGYDLTSNLLRQYVLSLVSFLKKNIISLLNYFQI